MDAEVIVVGLGIWGASALWRLARRGAEVLGIERYGPGHPHGSSHGGSRMFRLTCLENPALVPLARRSLRLWRDLQSEAGRQLFHPVGGLLVGPADGVIAGGTVRAATSHDIEIEQLSPAELAARFPQHAALAPGDLGVFEPSAGLLRAEDSVRAALDASRRVGARTVTDTRVLAIETSGAGVAVHTAARTFTSTQAVITVGACLPALVAGLPLETVRMPLTWFAPAGDVESFDVTRFPVFMRELDDGVVLWGNGRESGHEVKLGVEGRGVQRRLVDPERSDLSVTPPDWTAPAELLPRYLPGLRPVPTKIAPCMFSATPDGQFVIGRPARAPQVVLAGGCNAHGFKHATGIGEVLADLVERRAPLLDLGWADPDRFGSGDVVLST